MLIESVRNENVRRAKALLSSKGRLEQGLHFIEGERLVRDAIASKAPVLEAFVEQGHDDAAGFLEGCGARIHTVTRQVMQSMTDTRTPQWICAAVKTPDCAPPADYPKGLIVALDCVQDPGNVGTVIRTADAMGAVGILVGRGCADPFAPKPLRAAMGSTYHVPIWMCGLEEQLQNLKQAGCELICGHLAGEETLPPVGQSCCLIIGNEGNGVSEKIADMSTRYRLPMFGRAESLNASVAAGIMIYDIARSMRR